MSSSGGKGEKQTTSSLQTQALSSAATANSSIAKAEEGDPFDAIRRQRVKRILDWDEKGGSVRDFPDQSALSLYTDAKQVTDAGRVGKGYGSLADGANPNYVAQLDKENELTRGLEASRGLEEHVNNSILGARAEAGDLSAQGDALRMNIAQMRNANANSDQDRYLGWLARPKPQSFLKQLALGVAGGAASNPGIGTALKMI
jgi:hypothetical protein